ncbi:MAG: hypothetical protein LBK68_07415 [Candidatus Margulisbacteria bacterium]|jgi:pectate lyase|nr:hypothetical protein [Candidatus Margulisiibacteriota bacterium]
MNINWQKLFVSLTILALGLSLAGCGKTASSAGGSSGGGNNYQRTSDTVETIDELLDALESVDDVIIPADTTITIDATVTINAGKNLIVAEDAILNVSDNVRPALAGTITIESGAMLVDYGAYERATHELDGPWQTNDDASIVYETGSQGYRYHPSYGLLLFLGTENDAAAIFQLTDGELVLKKAGYELYGDATVKGTLQITGGEKVYVKDGGELTLDSAATIKLDGAVTIESGGVLKDTNDSGGTIWSGNGNGSLTFKYNSEGYVGNNLFVGNSGLIKLNDSNTEFTLRKADYLIKGAVTIQDNYTSHMPVRGESGASITVSNGKTVSFTSQSLTLTGDHTYVWDTNTWTEQQ